MTLKTVPVQQKILGRNDAVAARNREWLAARGITALNLISAPGSGKTRLLERTLDALRGRIGCAVITGDVRTDNDARRLADKGAPVCQIETMSACHLDAQRVAAALETVVEAGTRLLFIENVGNLVCPSAFDLGETFKVGLVSVTEGEDKPVKYPSLFTRTPVALITKTDLLPHLDVELDAFRRSLQRVRPDIRCFALSARTGDGMPAWIEYLADLAG